MVNEENSLEDRIARIEEMMKRINERLERLERLIESSGGSTLAIEMAKLAISFTLPPTEVARIAMRALEVMRSIPSRDDIMRSVIEVLSSCKPLTLTEIEKRARRLRGTASKHSIRKRLDELVSRGLVVTMEYGSRKLYTLKNCLHQDSAEP